MASDASPLHRRSVILRHASYHRQHPPSVHNIRKLSEKVACVGHGPARVRTAVQTSYTDPAALNPITAVHIPWLAYAPVIRAIRGRNKLADRIRRKVDRSQSPTGVSVLLGKGLNRW